MTTNYSNWSVDKLNKEIEKIQKVIKTKEARDKKATLAKLVSVARKSGFELHELLGSETIKIHQPKSRASKSAPKKASGKRGKVAPKYKNPANGDETWTGRGRQPLWVKEYVQNGGSLDQVTIVR